MTQENVRALMLTLNDKVLNENKIALKNKLISADDSMFDYYAYANVHNPILIIVLSIFVGGFGVDRFFIRDIGLGVAKLLLSWLTFGIWPLIDIFFCYRKAKAKNFATLMAI